jgi:hypothetical protein
MPSPAKLSSRLIWTTGYSLLALLIAQAVFSDSTPVNNAVAQNGVAPQAAANTPHEFWGPSRCGGCHTAGSENVFGANGLDFAVQSEAKVVAVHDKHFLAYKLLEGELGQRMQAALRTSSGDNTYKVTTDSKCLACHADLYGKPRLENAVKLGVTCESCHGASSAWDGPHALAAWREKSGKEKEALGFVDVRNPAKRAQKCFSCQIGNVKEGKVVTHEMYAVGHPPLPGMEIETFVSQMPTHWRSIREKGDFEHRDTWIAKNLGVAKEDVSTDLVRSKAVLISGVVALRESVNLFVTGGTENKQWPDFAAFDCIACHHDLASPSWRQRRGYAMGVPGRPLPYAWPTALVKLAIRQRTQDDDEKYKAQVAEFETHLRSVYSAALKSPFGNPDDLRKLGLDFDAEAPGEAKPANLIEWLDQLADDVFHSKVDKAAAKVVLSEVVNLPARDYPDFHSARQLIWAFRTISTEMNLKYPAFKSGTDNDTAIANKTLLDEWRAGAAAEAEAAIDKQLAEIGFIEKLGIQLPAGQKSVVAELLPDNLEMISNYDQDWFREQLPKLNMIIDGE